MTVPADARKASNKPIRMYRPFLIVPSDSPTIPSVAHKGKRQLERHRRQHIRATTNRKCYRRRSWSERLQSSCGNQGCQGFPHWENTTIPLRKCKDTTSPQGRLWRRLFPPSRAPKRYAGCRSSGAVPSLPGRHFCRKRADREHPRTLPKTVQFD